MSTIIDDESTITGSAQTTHTAANTPTVTTITPANMITNNNNNTNISSSNNTSNRYMGNRPYVNASNHPKYWTGLTADIQVVLGTTPEKLNNQI
eukprot:13254376-Ditylum_brightwellii.AAC.1